MKRYLDLMRRVREHAVRKGDRTGTGTLSVFGYQMRFGLGTGFPVVTTQSIHMRSVIHELPQGRALPASSTATGQPG